MTKFESLQQFYKGKRVLVTGHTGFKGSWLCLMLRMLGAEVYGYALAAPTEPALFDILKLSESNVKVRLTRGRTLLRNVLKEEWDDD